MQRSTSEYEKMESTYIECLKMGSNIRASLVNWMCKCTSVSTCMSTIRYIYCFTVYLLVACTSTTILRFRLISVHALHKMHQRQLNAADLGTIRDINNCSCYIVASDTSQSSPYNQENQKN